MGRHIGFVTVAVVLLCSGEYLSATLILEDTGYEYSVLGNSNSMVIDDIEYYFELDKSIYERGENVEMLYRVTNLKDQNVTFQFSTTLQNKFWIDKNDSNIWEAPFLGYTIPTEFTLAPGDNKTFTYTWDMEISPGVLLDVGDYIALGGLYDGPGYYDFTKVGVAMEVVPEPLSITFLMFGLTGIICKRKRRNILSQH